MVNPLNVFNLIGLFEENITRRGITLACDQHANGIKQCFLIHYFAVILGKR